MCTAHLADTGHRSNGFALLVLAGTGYLQQSFAHDSQKVFSYAQTSHASSATPIAVHRLELSSKGWQEFDHK